jgi:hypothetical protein
MVVGAWVRSLMCLQTPRAGRTHRRAAVRQSSRATASCATTDFVEFEGRSHLLVAGPGWEEVAGYVAGWLDRVLAEAPAVSEVE